MATRDYKTLKVELEKLQAEPEAARNSEVKAVISELRAKAAEYGLTADDVFPPKKVKASKTKGSYPRSIRIRKRVLPGRARGAHRHGYVTRRTATNF